MPDGPATLANHCQDDRQAESQDPKLSEPVHEWYFQDPFTKQPAGPWTLSQLHVRWCRSQIDGLTPVWRSGNDAWRPLAELPELKESLRALDVDRERGSDPSIGGHDGIKCNEQSRVPLDQVPLTHTYTSDEGALYVYDTIDDDWKSSDVYEALLREEVAERGDENVKAARAASGKEADGHQKVEPFQQEVQEALQELLSDEHVPIPKSRLAQVRAQRKSRFSSLNDTVIAPTSNHAPTRVLKKEIESEKEKIRQVAEGEPLDQEKEAKRKKRREYRERKKLKRQAGIFTRTNDNPNVYVSGLPPDVTMQELEPIFKRAGVIKLDPETGSSKIRIYMHNNGSTCKGDALVSYANAASVELAIRFLHEFELRPNCQIAVQQADFEEHERDLPRLSKDELKSIAAKRKAERAKYMAAKNAQKEAVSWSGEMDDGTGRRIVVLRHMFSLEEAECDGPCFYRDLTEEVQEECEKIGEVLKVTPLEGHKRGLVCVKFRSSSEAEACIRVMDGRYFAGRTIEASFYDGKTDLRALGVADPMRNAPSQSSMTCNNMSENGGDVLGVRVSVTSLPAGTCIQNVDTAPAQPPGPLAVQSSPGDCADVQVQKEYDDMLNEQSSDSDSELRVRTEE